MRRLAALALLLVGPVALSAPPSPALIVKYRVATMKASGQHLTAVGMIAKGESDRTQDLVMHATALHELARTLGSLFPTGSGPAPGLTTEAKPEIWTQADKFATAVKAFETETAKLVEVAKGGDLAATKTQWGAVGGACGDCHDVFKVEDDH